MSGGHDSVSPIPDVLFNIDVIEITNSTFTTWVLMVFLLVFSFMATRKRSLVPSGMQNLLEFFFEGVYNLVESILGPDLTKRTIWFFATVFLFILVSNWSGLLPITGNLTFDGVTVWRPGTADVCNNLAMSLVFMALWVLWAIQENGVVGFFKHIFAPKGHFEGIMLPIMIVMSLGIGLIEIISIVFRPISLSFRLYGNIFGGENVMHSMMIYIVQIPFYFLEIIVGLIQALVFTLLTAVFTALICEHEHKEEH
ncbi:MAG: ATP synthase F0 subunit A [Planctomycetota bacterium]|nr:MAG: ATP synthase F0 subunit A [Planctomycetota bacterium]